MNKKQINLLISYLINYKNICIMFNKHKTVYNLQMYIDLLIEMRENNS